MRHGPARPDPSLPPCRVNLLSDTQTRPTPAMREVMARAECGDEQAGDDPSVLALCERVAQLTGKQAAMFLPSGTMCNVIAVLTQCRPGEEILAHESAHVLTSEGGAHAALTGVQILPLRGPGGQFGPDEVRAAIRPHTRYAPTQRMLCVEQTSNIGGGTVWPLAGLDAVSALAKEQGWVTHMDGARLMNAVVAAGVPAARMCAGFDTVWIDFTKGLGAPLGAVLAGSADMIDQAWRWKQRLGGSMRQAGLSAAGCLYALDHHVERLADDHRNAARLAEGLARLPGVAVVKPETNLVFFELAEGAAAAADLTARLARRGIRVGNLYGRLRACTHLDVTAAMIEEAITAFAEERAAMRKAA